MEIQRSIVRSYYEVPRKPECQVLNLSIRNWENILERGEFRDLNKALSAFYFPGREPPEMKITDAERAPEYLSGLLLKLIARGIQLECDPPEVKEIGGKIEGTVTFYVARM
jgi:hypothetical protein